MYPYLPASSDGLPGKPSTDEQPLRLDISPLDSDQGVPAPVPAATSVFTSLGDGIIFVPLAIAADFV